MARGKKGIDGVDKVIDLFPAGSHKMVERLLRRAAERDARIAGRNVQRVLGSAEGLGRGQRKIAANLGRELGKALRHRGDVGGNKASIRQKAPDSGGRPFHFAHSVVKKEDATPAASTKAAKAAGAAAGGKSGSGKSSRAAAHMRYIERELAVERTYGPGLEESGVGRGASRLGEEGDERGHEREVGSEAAHATTAGAGQGYIENPVKLANGERIVFSYGTIGDRFEDRVGFWEQLEEAEAHPEARVQHRLIVELPHEASAQARFEMMRAFTKRFEDDGVPFWAALHAPGKDNDSRNFHAHIVYSERPARRMVDPDAPERGEQWDFAIVRHWIDSSRHHSTSRPHRQEKLRSYNARNFVKSIRRDFSDVVNAVLERDDVRDASGAKVRYDARSYRDMGVDAVPMRSINRIVADKLKGGKLTVLDGDYTKRMIATELREAAAKRHEGVLDLIALDDTLRATANAARPSKMNPSLPKDMRISPWANPSKAALKAAGRKVMEARHAALHVNVMERATVASLERVIAATSPKAVAAANKTKDPVVRAEAPSLEAARLLHAAALDELEETRQSTATARRTVSFRISAAVNAWKDLVGGPPPEMSPTVKAAIQDMDQREEAAERHGPGEAGQVEHSVARKDGQRDGSKAAGSAPPRNAAIPAPDTAAALTVGPVRANEPSGDRPKTAPAAVVASVREAGAATESDRPVGAVAARVEVEAAAAARQKTTAPASTGVTRPISMEDALRVRMPPTTAELTAASAQVSTWIKAIAEAEADPAKRMVAVEVFLEGLMAQGRWRRRTGVSAGSGEPADGDRLLAGTSAVSGASSGEGRHGETPASEERPATDIRNRTVTTAGPTAGAEKKVEAASRSAEAGSLYQGWHERIVSTDSQETAAKASETDQKPNEAPQRPQLTSTPQEAADDERRRKRHEDEEKKRKLKRKAVLGRKNRVRDRGR